MANRRNPAYPGPGIGSLPYIDDNGIPTIDPGTSSTSTTPATSTTSTTPVTTPTTTTAPATTTTPTTTTTPADTSTSSTSTTTRTSTPVPDITQQNTAYQAIVQQARDALDASRDDVLKIQSDIDGINSQLDPSNPKAVQGGPNGPAGQQLMATLRQRYQDQASAQIKLAQANETYATVATKAIDSAQLTGVTADKAKADAEQANALAAEARNRADILTKGSPSQIALAENQAAQAAAQGRLDDANAGRIKALQPGEVANLDATNGQLKAQTSALQAQADKDKATAGLTGTQDELEKAKLAVAGRVNEATTASLEAQAAIDKNKVQGLPTAGQQGAINEAAVGQAQANVGATQASTAANQALARSTDAGVQQKLQGPTYGLQDQIDAIRKIQQSVFGPGGSGNPQQADDLLKQFFTATVGGTTPFEASKEAGQQLNTQYGTQMQGVDSLQQAMASRASSFAGTAGSALGQLAQMNQWAPKGSTAGADAYQEVLDNLQQRMQSQFAPVQLPNAPQLPPFLQAFAAGHQAGQQSAQQGQPQGQSAPTINVNVNGQPAGGFNPQASTAAMNTGGFMDTPQGRAAMAMLGGGAGPATGPGPGGAQPIPNYTGGPAQPQPIPNYPAGQGPPPMQNAGNNTGYSTPPSIPSPNQSFAQGMQSGMGSIPAFANSYLPNPMGMLGLRQGGFSS